MALYQQSNVSAFQYAKFVTAFLPKASFNFMAVVTVCGDFGAPQNETASLKVCNLKVRM